MIGRHRHTTRRDALAALSLGAALLLAGCGDGPDPDDDERAERATELRAAIVAAGGGRGLDAFRLPDGDDLASLPQDPSNPLGADKVALGRMLFHDTAFALGGRGDEAQSWSCATCHHAAAGFKAGAAQGIGEGGIGFGANGSERRLDTLFDASAPEDDPRRPDLQPVTSPTVLNGAFQDVMLWNGQFGNAPGGINAGVDPARLTSDGTPKEANAEGLSGLETQALAGLGVHRLRVAPDTELQRNPAYLALWEAAYPDGGSGDVTLDAAKAIAAFERTVVADRAPFQRWLGGDADALDVQSLRGGALFFGRAGCVDCHRGPALSSEPGATADEMFHAVGFADYDAADTRVHGTVEEATSRGRGGFTGNAREMFRFKVPTLYNLVNTDVFGHGASFDSVRAVVEHKNAGAVQNEAARANLDPRVRPLGLTDAEVDDLVAFLERALYDPELARYQPETVPSGRCVIVDAFDVVPDGRCPETLAD